LDVSALIETVPVDDAPYAPYETDKLDETLYFSDYYWETDEPFVSVVDSLIAYWHDPKLVSEQTRIRSQNPLTSTIFGA